MLYLPTLVNYVPLAMMAGVPLAFAVMVGAEVLGLFEDRSPI